MRTITDNTQTVMTNGTHISNPVMKYFFKVADQLQAQEPVPPWHGGGLSGLAAGGALPPLKSVAYQPLPLS